MSEIRYNKATNQWVIFAPARGKRPRDYQGAEKQRELPEYDPGCPFCPGNEEQLPGIISEQPGGGQISWQTRIVPNKYPALTPSEGTKRRVEGIYLTMTGYGRHEVIIESPWHNRDPAHMSVEELNRIIETYHRRYIELMDENTNMTVILFRNHGPRAGTSLVHPHSQLVATGIVPHDIRWREIEAQRYFDKWGSCVLCDILKFEARDRSRVIQESDNFLTFVPFSAEVPFEIWIVPKRHQADYGAVSTDEKIDLALALGSTLKRFHDQLNDPDYNYVIHSAARYKAGEPHLHWYLQIQPRLTTQAGFEIGTGMRINPSLPEEDARFLREEIEDMEES